MAFLRSRFVRRMRPLRREALIPLPAFTRYPTLIATATAVILVAALTDAVMWTQGLERRALLQDMAESELEVELLRFENNRLRRQNLELSVRASGIDGQPSSECQWYPGLAGETEPYVMVDPLELPY